MKGWMLGTKLQKFTKWLGFKKPCSGCQKRAEKLNEISRKGFFGLLAGAAAVLAWPLRALADHCQTSACGQCCSCQTNCSTPCNGSDIYISCCVNSGANCGGASQGTCSTCATDCDNCCATINCCGPNGCNYTYGCCNL